MALTYVVLNIEDDRASWS